jgi:hypothetical protein
MEEKIMKEKRFYILQANSLNKEDIDVKGYGDSRYNLIAKIRAEKEYEGQKALKVQTLMGAHRMRLTYFQDRSFYIRIQRELHLLDQLPTPEQENSKFYKKTVDIDASEKFLEYINSLPEEVVKPKTLMSQLQDQEQ